VRLRPGTGKVVINGREFEDYFPNALQRAAATEAFRVVEAETTYDVDCDIQGGGIAGQAGALRMAIARSILELDEEKRSVLRKAGLLTRGCVCKRCFDLAPTVFVESPSRNSPSNMLQNLGWLLRVNLV
jgi:ribosomal protein S9